MKYLTGICSKFPLSSWTVMNAGEFLEKLSGTPSSLSATSGWWSSRSGPGLDFIVTTFCQIKIFSFIGFILNWNVIAFCELRACETSCTMVPHNNNNNKLDDSFTFVYFTTFDLNIHYTKFSRTKAADPIATGIIETETEKIKISGSNRLWFFTNLSMSWWLQNIWNISVRSPN